MAAKKAPPPDKGSATPGEPTAPTQKKAPARDNVDLLDDLQVMATIELGRTWQPLESAVGLGEQSLIELDKRVGDPVDVLLNGKLFARGEVVTVNENFGVRLTEIIGQA